jgi:ketopantoate hydroxymethyltransferase
MLSYHQADNTIDLTVLKVGDSLGMVTLGFDSTTPVTMEVHTLLYLLPSIDG